jgi:hypothetical protein
MGLDDGSERIAMISKFLRMLNPRWHLLKREIANQHVGPYVENNSEGYLIAIICRGEQLLYTDENGALVLEISIPGKWFDANSIGKWDEVRDVSDLQRQTIIDRVRRYFNVFQGVDVNIISSAANFGVSDEK